MKVAIALVLALALAACGDESDEQAEPEEPPPVETDEEPEPTDPEAETTLEGTLGGDPELEGGCAWLDTDEGRFEVLWPEGYEVAFDPVRLLDPGGETVATDGDTLAVEGRVADDLMSVCQVGTIFEASGLVGGPNGGVEG